MPTAYLVQGMLQESADWVTNGDRFHVAQVSCMGQGAESCAFTISKEPGCNP